MWGFGDDAVEDVRPHFLFYLFYCDTKTTLLCHIIGKTLFNNDLQKMAVIRMSKRKVKILCSSI